MSRAHTVHITLLGIATVAIPMALVMVFFYAPTLPVSNTSEMNGVVQKIFYFHVGSAINMLILLLAAGILSLLFLVRGDLKYDHWAGACADTGTLLGMMVLCSGPLWAKKAWGTWWNFEPRLMLVLLVFLMYLGYAAMRRFGGNDMFTRKLAAGISVLGIPAIIFIRIAVNLWGRKLHPENLTSDKSQFTSSAPEIQTVFYISILTILVFSLAILLLRKRIRSAEDSLESCWHAAQDADIDV